MTDQIHFSSEQYADYFCDVLQDENTDLENIESSSCVDDVTCEACVSEIAKRSVHGGKYEHHTFHAHCGSNDDLHTDQIAAITCLACRHALRQRVQAMQAEMEKWK